MKWHPSGVTRTRIRVIAVNFSEILIKGKKIWFELARNFDEIKMSENWGEIQPNA